MSKRLIGLMIACLVVAGGALLIYHYYTSDDTASTGARYSYVQITSDTMNDEHYCVEGRRVADKPDELYLHNCGQDAVRLHIAFDKNDRSKARLYKPGRERWVTIEQPELTAFVGILNGKGDDLDMSISLNQPQ